MATTFAVTVSNPGSGNKYYIDGVLQDTVNMVEGATYIFDQSAGSNSGHPLRFSTASDGTHSGGSEYTTGVTTAGTPGSSGAYTQIVVSSGAPVLYYYCTNHSGMGGTANTLTNVSVDVIFGSGWGRAGWSTGTWSQPGINSFSMAASLGTETVVEGTGINVSPSGIISTFAIGTYAVNQGTGVTIVESGVDIASTIGTLTSVTGDANVTLSTGTQGSYSIGAISVTGGINFSVTGVQAVGTTGAETVTQGTGVVVAETGVQAQSAIGTASVEDINVGVTGVEATGIINLGTVWQPIVPDQDPNWIEIGKAA